MRANHPSARGIAATAFLTLAMLAALAACSSADAPPPPPTTAPFPERMLTPAPTTTASVSPPAARTAEPSAPAQPLAPKFELASADGGSVSLDSLLEGRRATALVFYRGLF